MKVAGGGGYLFALDTLQLLKTLEAHQVEQICMNSDFEEISHWSCIEDRLG